MNRDAALSYLQGEFADIATEAGIDQSPLLSAYGIVIDQSLRTLGYTESQLGSTNTHDDEVDGYLALLDYFALTRFMRIFAMRTDVSVSGAISATQSQTFRQVKILRDEAEKRLNGLGLSPTTQMEIGRFTLDFLEPDLQAGGLG
jgi:hypothetical protein